jgi:DNA primase
MDVSAKDQIKERLPIAEVVGSYVKLERAGRNLRARCPFHKERTPSFNVSPERGSYYCFGCGEKGDIFSFVEKMEGVDFRGALRILAEKAGVELTPYRGETGPSKDEKERLYDLHEAAVGFFEAALGKREDVQKYLLGRGLTADTIAKWRLGYAPADWRLLTEDLRLKGFTDSEMVTSGLSIKPEKEGSGLYDRFRGRIMFPIFDVGGRAIAFSGRFFERMEGSKEEEPAKYVNSPETPLFRKSHVLYGLDKARSSMRRSDAAILVEGQMDLLMMHQVGYSNTIAASGTALTEDHLRSIAHSTKRLVLALDADTAGVRSALRSAQMAFHQGFELRVASFPEGKDPADVGKEDPEQLKEAVRKAQSAVEFFLGYVRAHTKDERGFRRAVQDEVLPLVAAMGSRMDQAHFLQVIARSIGLPEEDIRADMAKVKVQTPTGAAEAGAVPPPQNPIDRIHFAGALVMLLDPDNGGERLQQLLGNERFIEIEQILEENRERLLFSLESDAYGESGIDDLYDTIQREVLKEEIERIRREQHDAKTKGDSETEALLAKKLQELIRKQHGLGQ